MSKAYLQRGVSPSKEDVRRAVRRTDPGLFPGAFCKVVPDTDGDFVAVLHADGAGTKSLVAYLEYRESGSTRAFEGIAQDSAVMNIDDMLCVGAVDGFLLSNTIGRNAHRVGGEVVEAVVAGYEKLAARMRKHGVHIVTAGGETADVGDLVSTIIVDSTVYARVRRDEVIDCSGIAPGAAIVALASYGRASYEDRPNSGIGSNGFTAARHVLLHRDYGERYPETFSPTIDRALVYRGRFHLGDILPGTDETVSSALLAPTRTYAPIVKQILSAHAGQVSGIIHCTGGGQTKCLSFGRDLHFRKVEPLDVPPLFRVIMEEGGIEPREMYEIFNMGHRLEIYCEPQAADEIASIARRFGVEARTIGEVEPSSEPGVNQLTVRHEGDTLTYRKPAAD